MTSKQPSNAIERERSNTKLQLEAKRRSVRDITNAIARLERERHEAQVMVDYYVDSLARTGSHRSSSVLLPDLRALKLSVVGEMSRQAEAFASGAQRLLMHVDCGLFGRR